MWTEAARYPDPRLRSITPAFDRYRLFNAPVERLATGLRWAEGPVWFGDRGALLVSDIPNDVILCWDERTRAVSTYRRPSGHANGNTRDRQGRLISCEHQHHRVTRTEHDGTITVLADQADGRPLNSPNDVVVSADGAVWFTDPTYGRTGPYEGGDWNPSTRPSHVYRIDPDDGAVTAVITALDQPNGLAFSPDETLLYVVDSGVAPSTITRYRVDGARLGPGEPFVDAGSGGFDGFRLDEHGNLWCGYGGDGSADEPDGVRIFDPEGTLIGAIDLPERCANLCFGGARRDLLLMAASRSLYGVYVGVRGGAALVITSRGSRTPSAASG